MEIEHRVSDKLRYHHIDYACTSFRVHDWAYAECLRWLELTKELPAFEMDLCDILEWEKKRRNGFREEFPCGKV